MLLLAGTVLLAAPGLCSTELTITTDQLIVTAELDSASVACPKCHAQNIAIKWTQGVRLTMTQALSRPG